MSNVLEYKGYTADLELCFEKGIMVGHVHELGKYMGFHSTTLDGFIEAFRETVDAYLEICEERGIEPEKL